MKSLSLQRARPTFPALVVGIVLVALWAYARFSRDLHEPVLTPAAFIGWLTIMFLLATTVVVLWTAAVDNRPHAGGARRTFLAYALVSDLSGALLFLIGFLGGLISLWELLKLYLILVAWLGLWTSFAGSLRRFGTGFSAVTTLALALLLFAAPAIGAPLMHVAANWGETSQTRLVIGITHATPILAALDALQNSLHLTWSQLPDIYHRSDEFPIPLPAWWVSTTGYAVLALLLWLIRRPWRKSIT